MRVSLSITSALFALFCGLSAGVAPLAQGTTFMPTPFPERVNEAEAIVRATVGQSYSDWAQGRDGSRRIYTFTEMKLREVIKESGSRPIPGQAFVVRELGGTKEGLGMQVSGTAQFTAGEDVVLMLGAPNADGSFDVRGMMMGKYMVMRNRENEEILIGPGLDGASGGEGPAFHAAPGEKTTQWTLDRLKTLVREQQGAPSVTSPSPGLAQPTASPSVGASPLQLEEEAPDQEGSPAETGRSGRQTRLWLLGLVGLLAVLVWKVLRTRL